MRKIDAVPYNTSSWTEVPKRQHRYCFVFIMLTQAVFLYIIKCELLHAYALHSNPIGYIHEVRIDSFSENKDKWTADRMSTGSCRHDSIFNQMTRCMWCMLAWLNIDIVIDWNKAIGVGSRTQSVMIPKMKKSNDNNNHCYYDCWIPFGSRILQHSKLGSSHTTARAS